MGPLRVCTLRFTMHPTLPVTPISFTFTVGAFDYLIYYGRCSLLLRWSEAVRLTDSITFLRFGVDIPPLPHLPLISRPLVTWVIYFIRFPFSRPTLRFLLRYHDCRNLPSWTFDYSPTHLTLLRLPTHLHSCYSSPPPFVVISRFQLPLRYSRYLPIYPVEFT